MKILYSYLKDHKWLLLLTLFLATINQVFSLLDPLIFRHVLDNYAMKFNVLSSMEFFNAVMLLLGAALGVALVSRIAKNFQDYFTNVFVQRPRSEEHRTE